MPWTNDPVNVPADAVRSMVGDKNASAPLLGDGEYAKFLAATGNNIGLSAHRAALALEGSFAGLANKTVGPLHISYSDKAKGYHELAVTLLANMAADPLAVPMAVAIAGGITDPVTGNAVIPFFDRSHPG